MWSSRQAARILLVVAPAPATAHWASTSTLERRRGAKIRARAIYRDPLRSSRSQVVKASGLRWISLMWLGHVPWAGRHWALPVLTVLAPSTRYYQQQGRQHQKLTDWARQMVMQLRRWLPHRPLVLVGDNSYAVLDLLHCCQSPMRNFLVPQSTQMARAAARPFFMVTASTQALLCTDPAADPTQILEWFVLRWQLEVTFHEVRTHLGVETQRQWSDLAIARTTPALLGLFSWTTLAAHALQKRRPMTQRKAAWYDKPSPTFVE